MKKNSTTVAPVKTAEKVSRSRKATDKSATKAKPGAKKETSLPLYCGKKNPFTAAAWEWVNTEDLWPGTEKPLCFIHPNLVFDIANAQERPLDLDDAKVLVYPEGPDAEMCVLLNETGEEKFFTPLNYAYAISPKGLQQIKDGVPLKDVKGFFRGGPYYVNKGRTVAKAFSGSPLRFNVAKGTYWRNAGSPLVIMATEKGTQERPVWGVPYSEIQNMIEAQARKTALHGLASKLAQDLTNGRDVVYRRRDRDWKVGSQPFNDAEDEKTHRGNRRRSRNNVAE